jgi:hypothetical protein
MQVQSTVLSHTHKRSIIYICSSLFENDGLIFFLSLVFLCQRLVVWVWPLFWALVKLKQFVNAVDTQSSPSPLLQPDPVEHGWIGWQSWDLILPCLAEFILLNL